ncbi:MAG TPA: alpha/beta fold hydrolase [Gammaproteobacteria bacterium]|nr:alpha/beta fold hydrolase [Gammaproteobacteria bacterium]
MLWQCPNDAAAALVLAHGAGAGMRHKSMQSIADAFERRGIATLRFEFPYMAAGRNRVDSLEVATQAIADAYAAAAARTKLPIWLGGHSFGGRMASHAVVDREVPAAGLIFCSFPLHMPGKPDTRRAQHLKAVSKPMLFLSGTRDELAEAALLEPLVASLPTAKLHWLDTADHGYRVLKRSRARTDGVFDEMAEVARAFMDSR